MYLAELWGEQEYARTLSWVKSPAEIKPEDVEMDNLPVLEKGKHTEFHIGLDHESALFQTFAGYSNYLAWMVFNRSPLHSGQATIEPWRIDLQHDIVESRYPFAAITDDEALSNTSWREVPLGVNTVTGWIIPILHFTGDKSRRDEAWTRMWYFSKAEHLRRASSSSYQEAAIGRAVINGVRWKKFDPSTRMGREPGGEWSAWSDQGEALPWDEICKEHEDILYGGVSPDVDGRS
jgi:hypothetical protein